MKPFQAYRIVNIETGKQLKPYQNAQDMAAFIRLPEVEVIDRHVDSPDLNLNTVYVRIVK